VKLFWISQQAQVDRIRSAKRRISSVVVESK
jgi:hypothetical protein